MGVRGQLRLPRDFWLVLVVAGICEVAGFFAYATGARHGIAVTAVLATLDGRDGRRIRRLFFGERLQSTQVLGIALTFAGVAALGGVDRLTYAGRSGGRRYA